MAHTDRRVWFITGSTSGFGRALVHAARRAGDRVVATARRVEALADLTGDDDVMTLALDVTRPETFDQALDDATARFGRIDVLVNNAGLGFVGALEETSLDDLRRVMDTMFYGPAALTRAIIPRMRRQGAGAIVQISSQGGQITAPGFSAYCAAKFALEGLSEAVAAEVAPFGIRVLIVEPGSFRTELLGRSLSAAAVMEAYAPTVGATRSYLAREDGRQIGDPTKAAAAIIDALDANDPPLRLALGPDAVDAIRAKHERLGTELTRWEAVSRRTSFADASSTTA